MASLRGNRSRASTALALFYVGKQKTWT